MRTSHTLPSDQFSATSVQTSISVDWNSENCFHILHMSCSDQSQPLILQDQALIVTWCSYTKFETGQHIGIFSSNKTFYWVINYNRMPFKRWRLSYIFSLLFSSSFRKLHPFHKHFRWILSEIFSMHKYKLCMPYQRSSHVLFFVKDVCR